ncbi:MAG: alkyl hydroperoxide reductase [Frondihabitans sp.]|nr:alkyl hydroperoxide reductase [Frondihabitans sp.]
MSIPEVGSIAPDFSLPGITVTNGVVEKKTFCLSAQFGAPVVLAFYPGDQTAVCTAQLCSYQAELAGFEDLGATVWGISKQDLTSHENFARKEGLTFPLLADENGVAVRRYGVGLKGLGLRRSVFVVDAQGLVRWKHVSLVGARFQNAAVLQEAITGVLA